MKRYDIDYINDGIDRFHGEYCNIKGNWLVIYNKENEVVHILSAYTSLNIDITEVNEKI